MKRTILALVSTVAGLVYLLTYKTVPLDNPAAASTPAAVAAAPRERTITGEAVQADNHGPVTVTLSVVDGAIVKATAVQGSTSPRSKEISTRALPQLNEEALTVQSDGFDTVSGATLTSEAYETSLQSALDQL